MGLCEIMYNTNCWRLTRSDTQAMSGLLRRECRM